MMTTEDLNHGYKKYQERANILRGLLSVTQVNKNRPNRRSYRCYCKFGASPSLYFASKEMDNVAANINMCQCYKLLWAHLDT